jgi:hypothetical protein
MSEIHNLRKGRLLGLPIGTAANRLRKSIMFMMAQKLGMDKCFRCGGRIETAEILSIEHKESWQLSERPYEKFFDLENIAFSHLPCNISAGSRNKVYADTRARQAAFEATPKGKLRHRRRSEKRSAAREQARIAQRNRATIS